MVGRGYVVASIEYRFSQETRFPAQIQDCKAAIRWLRAHAAEYGIDPRWIGVWGASAGGHLAALLGTSGKSTDFDVGENLDQSSAVQCVIDFFGPADFVHWGGNGTPRPGAVNGAIDQLFGGNPAKLWELARNASPVFHVTEAAPPFLIVHGENDNVVPVQQSVLLNSALKNVGADTTLKVIHGAGHGGPVFSTLEVQQQLAEFFDRHLVEKRASLKQ
jgi:acetyl esterase/lipase